MYFSKLDDYSIFTLPNVPPGACSCWALKKGCKSARCCFIADSESDVFQHLKDAEIFESCFTPYESDDGPDSINRSARTIAILKHWSELLYFITAVLVCVLITIILLITKAEIKDILSILLVILLFSGRLVCYIADIIISSMTEDLAEQWVQSENQSTRFGPINSER